MKLFNRKPAPSTPSDADRLLAVQHCLANAFQGRWIDMGGRDRHLYRQLIWCTTLDVLVQRRFDCFDLMCRLLGEGVARTTLRQIDAWLPSRY